MMRLTLDDAAGIGAALIIARGRIRLKFVPPLLPTLAEQAAAGDDWIHELKHDGFRTTLVADAHRVRAFTRNGNDWTDVYAPLVAAAANYSERIRRKARSLFGFTDVPF
jgi:ATP-dependent DNA ligase